MKKSLLMLGAALLFSTAVTAGEYIPYVGLDYVNMTPNFNAKYPDNYDIGSINAGLRFIDLGSVEVFAERSKKEKDSLLGRTSRGRLYGFGVDALYDVYSFSQGAILGTVGYGRFSDKLKYNGHTNKENGNALRLGVGGELNPTPELGFRAMYRYSISDSGDYQNSKEFSIGARYYFY